eukprot:snap_masked-scaffold_14-processed-gene-8.12-mRNA-1 protein AED:0.02 eAED:0.02 QI:85/1/1/1/0.66/0.5/4/195/633
MPPDQSFWVKDEYVLSCTACSKPFGSFNRRHHCRNCGEVFCKSCSRKTLPLPELNYARTDPQRLCEACFTQISISRSADREKVLKQSGVIGVEKETVSGLLKIYNAGVKQLEKQFKYDEFYTPTLTKADFESKPMVLLIGGFSTGKSSAIKYFVRKEIPGMRIGPEPTTDQFCVISGSDEMTGETGVIPGNALAARADKPFRSLQKFGSNFLNKFQCSQVDSDILRSVTFVDTPGVLSGEKQRLGRSYDYAGVVEWFANRSDRILLMFDAHKIDIGDEFQSIIHILKPHDDKIRVILNKAHLLDPQELLRVHGALMWSLGKVLKTPEVIRLYVGSFIEEARKKENSPFNFVFGKEQDDLLEDLRSLPHSAVVRKINEVVKRARSVKIHALLISHLRDRLTTLSGGMGMFKNKQVVRERLMEDSSLEEEFQAVARKWALPRSDFPSVEDFKKKAKAAIDYDFSIFPVLNPRMIVEIDDMIASTIPRLQASHMQRIKEEGLKINPFKTSSKGLEGPSLLMNEQEVDWVVSEDEFLRYSEEFSNAEPVEGKIDGFQMKHILEVTGLPRHVLKKIWELSDIDKDGALDLAEFSLTKHLVGIAQGNQDSEEADDITFGLPTVLPRSFVPPEKRYMLPE